MINYYFSGFSFAAVPHGGTTNGRVFAPLFQLPSMPCHSVTVRSKFVWKLGPLVRNKGEMIVQLLRNWKILTWKRLLIDHAASWSRPKYPEKHCPARDHGIVSITRSGKQTCLCCEKANNKFSHWTGAGFPQGTLQPLLAGHTPAYRILVSYR